MFHDIVSKSCVNKSRNMLTCGVGAGNFGCMATIRSIAEDLNLSAATVSRALRGTGGVNAETRSKVREAAERAGYSLSQRVETSKAIALVVSGKSQADMHELARRYVIVINDEFAKRGWRLHPIFVPDEDACVEDALAEFEIGASNAVVPMNGCLVIGRLPGEDPGKFHKILAERFDGNVVMLCRHDVINGLSGVSPMNYDGGAEAARLLLQAGHRRFGWVGSLGSRDNASERLGGVLTALRDAGGSLDCELWLNDRELLPMSTVADAFSQALPADRSDWPTAWVCSTDWLAAKLIVWARSQGIRVPEDISVVAFDNTRIAEELAETVITSVVFPYEQLARKAVELLDVLTTSPAADAVVWALPPRMRLGKTVATFDASSSA